MFWCTGIVSNDPPRGFNPLLIRLSYRCVFSSLAPALEGPDDRLNDHLPNGSGSRCILVWVAGFEPAASEFRARPSTRLTLHPECSLGEVDLRSSQLTLLYGGGGWIRTNASLYGSPVQSRRASTTRTTPQSSGFGGWARTSIRGSKARCPAWIRRPRNTGSFAVDTSW